MKKQASAIAQTSPEWEGKPAPERSELRAQKRMITQSERDEVKKLLRQRAEARGAGAECSEVRQ